MSSDTQISDEVRVLSRALDQAGDVLDAVHADDLDKPTPCSEWTVSQLADHLIAAPRNFLTMMSGEQPDWSATPPHVTEGWGPAFRVGADDLLHAWHERVTGGEEAGPDWQTAEFALHAWDLAVAVGWPLDRLDPEVAERGLAFMKANLRPEVRGEAFGPERTPPSDAGPYERLAAFAGREA